LQSGCFLANSRRRFRVIICMPFILSQFEIVSRKKYIRDELQASDPRLPMNSTQTACLFLSAQSRRFCIEELPGTAPFRLKQTLAILI
jgi:hypothetical protein